MDWQKTLLKLPLYAATISRHCFGKAWITFKKLSFLLFLKGISSFRHSQVLTFPSLSKSYPTKFKPLSEKPKKKTCTLLIRIFTLNQMSCKIITEGKLGEKDRSFPHLYNISWWLLENSLKEIFLNLHEIIVLPKSIAN